MLCYLYDAPKFLFFAPETADLPSLLYYSHIPSVVIALLVGLFVFLNARHLLLNKLLLLIASSFSVWVALSLLVWAGNDASLFAAIWPFFGMSAAFISIFSVYFIYVFLEKKDVSAKIKLVFLLLLLPILLFSHTNLGISGFNIPYCDAFQFEGIILKYYYNALGFLAMFWILALLIKKYKTAEAMLQKQIILMGVGIEFFLFSFITIIFIVTQLTAAGYFTDSSLEFYGLFGMTFFMVMMGVLIVRFKTFNVGAVASKALLVALLILIGSQFTYATSTTTAILTAITFILTAIVGFILIKSVNKEIKQRKELETLTKKLAVANERLKDLDKLKSEFVSIASHQLRSPLTAIRGYASLLVDGSYGKLPTKAMEALNRIAESAKNMAYSIEDYLNVSRIESGNMKYNKADFNLRDETEHITDDLRSQAIKQGLVMLFRTDMKSKGIVNADLGKVIQIIQNLINNSIKYTPEGSIKVLVRDDVVRKKIYIDIEDTGIGMNPESLETVFGKFERAGNANSVNIHGTGLGLFVAHKMVVAMEGNITAHSEGEGKGSRFTVELPLAM
jgi:signal transduction histidine kinase